MTPDLFTTGQAARICRVAPRTVGKWFDSGRLGGYRIPGSEDRRIPRAELVRFLQEHGMPLFELAPSAVLLVGAGDVCEPACRAPCEAAGLQLLEAGNGFEAGVLARGRPLHAASVCLALGRSEALAIARHLSAGHPGATLVALACEDETDAPGLLAAGFTQVFQRPFDPALLAEALCRPQAPPAPAARPERPPSFRRLSWSAQEEAELLEMWAEERPRCPSDTYAATRVGARAGRTASAVLARIEVLWRRGGAGKGVAQ